MKNFEFANPVKILFGKDKIAKLSKEIPADRKVLVIYGGGSIKKNNVYNQVIAALKQHQWLEFSGIEANPHYETCLKAIDMIREHIFDRIGRKFNWEHPVDSSAFLSSVGSLSAKIVYDGLQNLLRQLQQETEG